MGLDGSEIKSCCNQRWDLTTTTNYFVEIFGSINVDLTITPNYVVEIFGSFNVEIFGSFNVEIVGPINVEKSHGNSSGTPSA